MTLLSCCFIQHPNADEQHTARGVDWEINHLHPIKPCHHSTYWWCESYWLAHDTERWVSSTAQSLLLKETQMKTSYPQAQKTTTCHKYRYFLNHYLFIFAILILWFTPLAWAVDVNCKSPDWTQLMKHLLLLSFKLGRREGLKEQQDEMVEKAP